MMEEIGRANDVTPTNYLETVRGYKGLMKEKRDALKSTLEKLTGGLCKLDETSTQVTHLHAEMERARRVGRSL